MLGVLGEPRLPYLIDAINSVNEAIDDKGQNRCAGSIDGSTYWPSSVEADQAGKDFKTKKKA